MRNDEIEFLERISQALMRVSADCQSIPSLAWASAQIHQDIFARVQGQREKNLRDLQEGNGPVALRFKENGRINALITIGNRTNSFSHTPNYLPAEEFIVALGSARYSSECTVSSFKINRLLSEYISVYCNDFLHVSRRPLSVKDFKDPTTGFILPTIYEASGNNLRNRSVAKVDVRREHDAVKFDVLLTEASGSTKTVHFNFSVEKIDSCNFYGIEVYDALEACTFQGTQAHVHFDDIEQILRHYFIKNQIEAVPGNTIVEGNLKHECENELFKHFHDFSRPLIEAYKDKVPLENRTACFSMAGKIQTKNSEPYRWNSEISFNVDMEGFLTHLDYYFYVPTLEHSSAGSPRKVNVFYSKVTGLQMLYNNREIAFTQDTFNYMLDQLKQETFQY